MRKINVYFLDINQVSSSKLPTASEAKEFINNIIRVYSIDMLKEMKLIGTVFTAYTYWYKLENNISLSEFLTR